MLANFSRADDVGLSSGAERRGQPAALNVLRLFLLVILPVALDLLRPGPVSLPGIKRGIDPCTTGTRRRCFRNPSTILLPTIDVFFITGMNASLAIVCCILCGRLIVESACPGCVLTILHEIFPGNPLSKCYVGNSADHRNCITEQFVTFHIKFNVLLNGRAPTLDTKGALTEYRGRSAAQVRTR